MGDWETRISEDGKYFSMNARDFAAITAIEGLQLSPEGELRLRQAESLTPDERRAEIIQAFRNASISR